jgi:predicted 3-demethylubiquinone-9 3-methyltransferase (glyoxalase superfamily)
MGKKKAVRIKPKGRVASRITPFLWFDNQAEEAAKFYTSVFSSIWGSEGTKVGSIARYGEAGPGQKGTVMVATFQIDGQEFVALNGGPQFKFTEAVSFVINCKTEKEVDHFWNKLCEGGEESMCGWLKDKYGLSWQVVPVILNQMLTDKDPAKAKRVMEAMLKMRKIDIPLIKKAYAG